MQAAIYTLGCKVNQYETQAMEQELVRRGHTLVPFDQKADVYIVNTCSVTAVSDKKSRQMIRRCRKLNPNAVVAACGCYVQTHAEEAAGLDVDLIAGTGDRMAFLDLLEQVGREKQVTMLDDALRRREFEVLPAGGMAERTRAMLKVEDGCVNFCTYCIIPYARGPVRSLPQGGGCGPDGAPAAGGVSGAGIHRYRDLQLGPRPEKRGEPHRPFGGGVRRRRGYAAAAGQSGAPYHHGGLLPPCRRAAPSVSPLSSVFAVRL